MTVDIRATSLTSPVTRIDVNNGCTLQCVMWVTWQGQVHIFDNIPASFSQQFNRNTIQSEFGGDITWGAVTGFEGPAFKPGP